ncbi:Up-regulator of cell proliferation like [Actinidia chinensis var. chinensis]|uniref:Up-regulator of cell proliferation like n=1 Tax=Actinidia chinensis var. chinensis TaxID=1590841 RepID=A0A2R6QGF7_ACTCC|nr:Up-regulator of cell proliferation like [Actinidia chinensis var. chinensis]
MLGRVRPSSSSLECLELERSHSKIIKDDSLSIYEATLIKLRQGSQRDIVSSSEQETMRDDNCDSAGNSFHEEAMTIDMNCTPPSISSSSSDSLPIVTSTEPQKKMMSIICLFARYNGSKHAQISPEKAVLLEDSCSSAGSSPSTGR